MPKHRHLDPAAPLGRAVRLPVRPGRFAVPALTVAVTLAVAATFLPAAELPLTLVAIVVALPALVAALLDRAPAGAHFDAATASVTGDGTTDSLTGCADVASWDDAVEAALLAVPTVPVSVARLWVELPEPGGATDVDRLLVGAAVRLQEILRPGDVLARLGTAEFAILLPNCDARAAHAVLGRLRSAVPPETASHAAIVTWDGVETPTGLDRRAAAALRDSRDRAPATPLGDPGRLAAVEATGLAVRETTEEFDQLASSVAWMLGTPVVAITLFDADWQHYIGLHGLIEAGGPGEGMPAQDALCRTTVETGQALVVSDAARHPVLSEVPARAAFGIGACASIPIIDAGGHVLGSICSMVDHRHQWTADEVTLLRLTARRIATRLAGLPVRTGSSIAA